MNNYADINWNNCQKVVAKLQRRIIAAWNNKDHTQVYKLQEQLVNKFEARALAVRKVTTNKGSKTPGIDKNLIRTDLEKIETIDKLKNLKNYKAIPVKRVLIPKANGKLRPLGIPSIYDRCVQALYHLVLDPIAEEIGDKRSYGFRKNRSTHDVQQYTRGVLNQKDAARYVMDGDIKGFFDNISHEWIMNNIPMNKYILKQWLDAGFLHENEIHITTKGVPQGGIISPTIANIVLDGLEEVIENISKSIRKIENAERRKNKLPASANPKIHYVRYADDFLVTAGKLEYYDIIKPEIEKFLKERGVELNQDKTKIFKIEDGFDFLGFNFRKYRTTRRVSGEILLVKPSKTSRQKIRDKIKQTFKTYKNPVALISALNPILRGWGNYFQHVNASRTFYSIDYYVIMKSLKWIRSIRRRRGMKKALKMFFKQEGNRRWNFQFIKDGKTFKLFQMGSLKIKRYVIIRDLNPYLKENEEYFLNRAEKEWYKSFPDMLIKLLKKQKGTCSVCNKPITSKTEESLEVLHIQPREFKGNQQIKNLLLLHKTCHQSVTNCNDPLLLAKYVSQGIIKPLSERYKKLLSKKKNEIKR